MALSPRMRNVSSLMKTMTALTAPPRPAARSFPLNQFIAASVVASVAISALGLGARLTPVWATQHEQVTATLIVKLADDAGDSDSQQVRLDRVLKDAGLPLRADRPLGSGWWRVESAPGADIADRAAWLLALRADRRLAHAMPDLHEQRALVPNDPLFRDPAHPENSQWWLDDQNNTSNAAAAGFTKAWDSTTGAAAPVIAVLDSGITSHGDLNGHLLPGYNFVSKPEFANNGGTGRSARQTQLCV